METRIEVFTKENFPDAIGNEIVSEVVHIGITSVDEIRMVQVYLVEGDLSRGEIRKICSELLIDGLTQDYICIDGPSDDIQAEKVKIGRKWSSNNIHTIEITRKRGVMDPVESTVIKGIKDLGLSARSVKTAKRFLITGQLTTDQLETIANKVLANKIIEDVFIGKDNLFYEDKNKTVDYVFKKQTLAILDADDEQLLAISEKGQMYLTVTEMKAVQKHFAKLGRNPTDVELETIAQTWSEHCMHKTFKGIIDYNGEYIDDLLANTIVKATSELNKPWCVSVFKDNAGIIEFDENYNICFKVETHNHPSAIEPYGGANTGIGGVIRDTLGTGLGAKPILNTDVFCFGPLDMLHGNIPEGVLHPKRVFKGVVSGVRDYGNRMGIPTSNGAIFFDERYTGNPLVYCGNAGLIAKDKCEKESYKGDLILLVGGRTGRDGIHGATFSSVELTHQSEVVSGGAVQIGDPIMERKVADALLIALDRGLYNNITDCGAGGLSSAVGEMGESLGAVVDLEKVPLKYEGLSYSEIWISEAQERMVLSVPPENREEIRDIFEREEVDATFIGEFTGDRRLHLRYKGETVADIEMAFLHDGLPRITRKATWHLPSHKEPELKEKTDYGEDLKRILSSWNVCSKEWVIRQYDHEVQGGSVLKPLLGVDNEGPGDACIVRPVLDSNKGIIVSNGMNPKYGEIDPYHMASSAIDEALRQVVSVGGSLEKVALLDNFSWGNTDKPECLGGLVRASKGCYDTALHYEAPFISGKDSLNNEFKAGDKTIAIPPTLLISAICVMPDVTRAISMDVKSPGNLIYIVGMTKNELGGSHYYFTHGFTGNSVPKVDTEIAKKTMDLLANATGNGLVRSCHDCSEGGLAVAAAEMSFAGGYGMELDLSQVPFDTGTVRDDTVLFSESNTRFIVEVQPEKQKEFEVAIKGAPYGCIGKVMDNDIFTILSLSGEKVISEKLSDLKEAWQVTLRL
ncbi:phosphoribosylformylglycinamidine synthase [Candidatus Scalindua japonica]|uniref:Phosphoribosylformylglycinamidine synthase subunit PurL n=1 Tax=Candidatus Scalindua japonica TaxID=1284222 RepID=A0A286U402_9BACT|nr:phosphoribosylformylglycinamidine synthase subunit PurL [Candidatus Scalindua japonica]GAX62801.1 phosphoribosylformylglycinamidine synthase [Candidatus Scalindua japonica]